MDGHQPAKDRNVLARAESSGPGEGRYASRPRITPDGFGDVAVGVRFAVEDRAEQRTDDRQVGQVDPTHQRVSRSVEVQRQKQPLWREDATEYFEEVEQIMLGFEGRPHWGKMHTLDAAALRERYPRFDDFVGLRDRLDPERLFRNPYLDRVLGG